MMMIVWRRQVEEEEEEKTIVMAVWQKADGMERLCILLRVPYLNKHSSLDSDHIYNIFKKLN